MTVRRGLCSELWSLTSVLVILGCDMTQTSSASLAIVNARVWTGDARRPGPTPSPSPATASPPSARAPRSGSSRAGARVIDAQGQMVVAGLHRRARPLRRRRLPALVGAAARRATRPRSSSARIRDFARDASAGDVDHRRRLGSRALGRRAAARALDRLASRRTIPSGSTGSTATWRSPTRAALRAAGVTRDTQRRRRRHDRPRRRAASRPGSSRTTRRRSSTASSPIRRRRCRTARSTPR